MSRFRRRVVVTGLGAVSPIGLDAPSTWKNCLAGENGVRSVNFFGTEAWPVRIGAEVRNFEFSRYEHDSFRPLIPYLPRGLKYGLAAAEEAMADAGLNENSLSPHRFGLSMGAFNECPSLAEMNNWWRLERDFDPPRYFPVDDRMDLWISQVSSARGLCQRWRCGGPYYVMSAACASGTMSQGAAFRTIRRGKADVMLAGGFDGMVEQTTCLSFALLGALSTQNDEPGKAVRPFDLCRNGFVLGEGAAVLVFEELEHALQRGARIYAEVAGYASTMASESITDMTPNGSHQGKAMSLAVADAMLEPTEINYINAHGTSTRANDVSETRAIRRAFGAHADKIAVSSTKSMVGHLLHSAGAIEGLLTVLAIRDQVAPPTINYEHADPECDLDYVPNVARPLTIDAACSNSFAFGGNNATILYRRYCGASARTAVEMVR
ncbi:MAG: beta-ketoacyl-[acyl-carrier-protein] synthase family protein [Planctomycetaceae bacterium]|nr:beta-ketoacyl-[acyl-carrier-protein] synthase family protein [Planctomycetaceae bacterium]